MSTRISATAATFTEAIVGAGTWLVTSLLTGRKEAWDASAYWTVAYPVSLLLAGVLGYLSPAGAWRWGLVVMLAQAVTMAVLSGDYSLLPLGLILFGILAVPPMLVAWVAARRRGFPRDDV